MEITAENREYLWEVNIKHSGQTLRMHTSRQFPVQIFKEKGKRKKQPCHAKNAKKKILIEKEWGRHCQYTKGRLAHVEAKKPKSTKDQLF